VNGIRKACVSNGWKRAAALFHPAFLFAFLFALALSTTAYSAAAPRRDISDFLGQVRWGEISQDLLQQFDGAATRLSRSLDFGDSYVDVVLEGGTLGGVPVVTFFQMDKRTHGLKRVQVERPRHGVNPPAFRAIAAALYAAYGRPDLICRVPARPNGGYQAAAQELWVRGGDVISAIYRDTTLQAFEGCPFGVASGYCGLRGQLVVRISPADGKAGSDPCQLAARDG
jgi:hypothetical protein